MKYKVWLTPSGAVVMIVCFFLPWAHFSCTGVRRSVSGYDLGGILWLIPIMAVVILTAVFVPQLKVNEKIARLITLGSGCLVVIALVWKLTAILTGPRPAFGLIKPHAVGFRLGIGAVGTMVGLVGVVTSNVKTSRPSPTKVVDVITPNQSPSMPRIFLVNTKIPMPTSLTWRFLPFYDLTLDQLYDLLKLRQEVFVVEQNCPYLDADGLDLRAHHLLGYNGTGLVAYLRLIEPGGKYAEPSIGRVITRLDQRRTNLGRDLMAEGIRRSCELYPGMGIRISAQARLEKFYLELGFETVGGPYDEDGIPHLEMLLPADA